MPWLLIMGGQACRVSGKLVNRASLQHCATSKELGETIDRNLKNIYSFPDGYEPPSPQLKTFALGFQIEDHSILKNKVLPEMQNRMKRLGVSWRYDAFYEDDPVEGSKSFNALSQENCRAWLQSVADNLLDSGLVDEEQIAMYEFTDRPDGFRKPEFLQVLKPWMIVSAATFAKESVAVTPAVVKLPVGKVSPSPPATAGPPHHQQPTPNDGAGPSRPDNHAKMKTPPKSSSDTSKQHKIAIIKTALHYNGYPTDVIEDLIKNKLKFVWDTQNNTFRWSMVFPNGITARRYTSIDEHPYPGGKVTPKSERKCAHCSKGFGHRGLCLPGGSAGNVAAKMENAIFKIRKSLQSAGYPPEVIEQLMKENFYIGERPEWKDGRNFCWKLRLPNGKCVRAYTQILKLPYSGGQGAGNGTQICLTPGCHQTLGHAGKCAASPSSSFSSMYDSDDDLAEDSEDEEEIVHQPEETRQERWKRRQWPMEKGDDGCGGGGDEGLASTEVISEDDGDYGDSVGLKSLEHEMKGKKCHEKAPNQSNKRTSPGDGDAGGSSPKTYRKKGYQTDISSDTKKEMKIASIKAALYYAGYPSDVIEDLLATKLVIYTPKDTSMPFSFYINLPNGKSARSLAEIERKPYPGGKITPKSETKCLVDEECVLHFGHLGGCVFVKNEAKDYKQATLNTVNKKIRVENGFPVPSARPKLLLSSSSDEDEHREEAAPAESPIYLLTTTEEEDTTSSSSGDYGNEEDDIDIEN